MQILLATQGTPSARQNVLRIYEFQNSAHAKLTMQVGCEQERSSSQSQEVDGCWRSKF